MKNMLIPLSLLLVSVEVNADTPTIYFENSTITGSGSTITVTRVPVKTSTGSIIYKDITTTYTVDDGGNISVLSGYPVIVDSKTLLLGKFKAGKYTATIGGKTYTAKLGGPGVGPSGSTAWSFSSTFVPVSATWYTGSLSANPEYARLKGLGINSPAYAYGVAGLGGCDYGAWSTGTLIGASQTGNNLTISSFSSSNGCGYGLTDNATPVDNVTWTLSP